MFNLFAKVKNYMASVDSRGWFPYIREWYAGAWQNNDEIKVDTILAYHAVYACITLIANDISKLPFLLKKRDSAGIWGLTTIKTVNDLLRKPNPYQNHMQFKQWWITSLLIRGNTYVLKERDTRTKAVKALYILDATKVNVLVAQDGSVFYQLTNDNLSGIQEMAITVPASEIIHDRINCLFHPLVGLSPLFACGLASSQGLKIQNDSSNFFKNGATPSGVLTAPGSISEPTAARMKADWETKFSGTNAGRVAVLGDGLKFEPMRMSATDAQLIEQLRWTSEVVCAAFHVPPYKVAVGPNPALNNTEALTVEYYGQCLQTHIESMELCLDEGVELPEGTGIELDLDVLFRMDSSTLIKNLRESVAGSIMSPNEARKRLNLSGVDGGESPMIQQQNYSLAALAKRDARPDPFNPTPVPPPVETEPTQEQDEQTIDDMSKILSAFLTKELEIVQYS